MAEQGSKPDRLESPEAPWRIILVIAGAGIVCVLIAVIALGLFYRLLLTGGPEAARAKPFPRPALETNLFRAAPDGAPSASSPPGVDAAMAMVAAKGLHAYDPVGGAS